MPHTQCTHCNPIIAVLERSESAGEYYIPAAGELRPEFRSLRDREDFRVCL